jgi:lysine 2,3-aminomutase
LCINPAPSTLDKGKTEVVAVTQKSVAGVPGGENGVIIFKLLRSAKDAPLKGKVAIMIKKGVLT